MADTHAHAPKHSYHLVDPSPWPIIGSGAAGLMFVGLLLYMHGGGKLLLILGILAVLGIMFVWWRDVVKEAQHQGQKHEDRPKQEREYGQQREDCQPGE